MKLIAICQCDMPVITPSTTIYTPSMVRINRDRRQRAVTRLLSVLTQNFESKVLQNSVVSIMAVIFTAVTMQYV